MFDKWEEIKKEVFLNEPNDKLGVFMRCYFDKLCDEVYERKGDSAGENDKAEIALDVGRFWRLDIQWYFDALRKLGLKWMGDVRQQVNVQRLEKIMEGIFNIREGLSFKSYHVDMMREIDDFGGLSDFGDDFSRDVILAAESVRDNLHVIATIYAMRGGSGVCESAKVVKDNKGVIFISNLFYSDKRISELRAAIPEGDLSILSEIEKQQKEIEWRQRFENKMDKIGNGVEELTARRQATRDKQSAGGKRGAKLAAEERCKRDKLREEDLKEINKRHEAGEKLDALFAEYATKWVVKASGVKSCYSRWRRKRRDETRGKYDREGKPRGAYHTLGHTAQYK